MIFILGTALVGLLIWVLLLRIWRSIESSSTSHQLQKLKQSRFQAREQRKFIELGYDPQDCSSFHRFRLLAKKSNCLFAKNAHLWGCREFDQSLSLKENVEKLIPSLLKFVTLADETEKLDGYIIEIKGSNYCSDVSTFASTVRQTLEIISSYDPSGINVMKLKGISSPSWYYSFCNIPIFITTFAPFYPQSHCRYMHSIPELTDVCYILLQPEVSFFRHDIGADTPETNWENPQTMRDRVRCSFRHHQRGYFIPSTNRYPVAEMVVLHPKTTQENYFPIKFWKEPPCEADRDSSITKVTTSPVIPMSLQRPPHGKEAENADHCEEESVSRSSS
jgi:FPC/CPF motif-containing protein YcgG